MELTRLRYTKCSVTTSSTRPSMSASMQAMRNAERRRSLLQGTLYLWPTTWSGADATMGALMSDVDSALIVVRASDPDNDNVVEFISSLAIVWPDLST